MILPEEKLLEALRICATNDNDKCRKCPYMGWCNADPINPYMNMPKDALETILSKESDAKLYASAYRDLREKLAKALVNLKRYGRRIREQREEILSLRAKLDGAIAAQETLQRALASADKCASCGDVIPEGRQVCPNCLMSQEVRYDTKTLC